MAKSCLKGKYFYSVIRILSIATVFLVDVSISITTAEYTAGPSAKSNRAGIQVVNFLMMISGFTPSTEFQGPTMPRSVI